MKRVGIMTYHNTRNFGGVLQAYALQEILRNLGAEVEIINYFCDSIQKNYKINKFYENKSLKEFLKWILTVKDYTISQRKFNNFFLNYFNLSQQEYNIDNIYETNNNYDIFITGSDQVWNMNLTNGDNSFFLNFVDSEKLKVSYAASFGYKELPHSYINITKELISDFDYISVRELEGQKIIDHHCQKESRVVLDPTLLLTGENWKSMASNIQNKDEYIFVYIVAPSKKLIDFARKLAKKHKCKVICTQYTHKKIFDFENRCDISPLEFLGLLNNAKYVVTTSFHGVALSINMNKQFFYELDSNKNNYNSRIETLINNLNINGREIKNGFVESENNLIDYKSVNNRLEELRIDSIEYIQQFLEAE